MGESDCVCRNFILRVPVDAGSFLYQRDQHPRCGCVFSQTHACRFVVVVERALTLDEAGINGVECGQSLVIASSLAINDLLFVLPQGHAFIDQASLNDESQRLHSISLFLLLPFVGVCGALFIHNR